MQPFQSRSKPYPSWLIRKVLQRYFREPAPARIPLLGRDRLAERNYLTLYLVSQDEGAYWIPQRFQENAVVLAEYVDRNLTAESAVPIENLRRCSFEATRFYDRLEIKSSHLWWFLVRDLPLVRVLMLRWDSIAQWWANRAGLPSAQRTHALQVAVNKALADARATISARDCLGVEGRMLRTPAAARRIAEWNFVLRSLVHTGELEEANGDYRVLPQALVSLDQYLIEERRQAAQRRLQTLLGFLSAISTIVAGLFVFFPTR
ncbi:hypothetical protein [Bordetella petrii]|uniref:hypothetical protein n=1 Tax=Bordetella petrii TaxID=94624 RepID=UPI0012DE63B4|nr:hypothetical protein [Bordetella petrii]